MTAGSSVARRVVWLSGRSSARHRALSPDQGRLLARAERHGFEAVGTGFPFPTDPGPWSPTPLLAASARNGWQWAQLRWSAAATDQVARHLSPLFAGTTGVVLAVCSSLGLELLATGLRGLAGTPLPSLRVVGLGPVCHGRVDHLDLRVAQGLWDPISAAAYRGPVHLRPSCGHLGYLARPEVGDLVKAAAAGPW